MSVPEFWDKAMAMVKNYPREKKRDVKSAVAFAAAVVVSLYRQSEI
jgi:hypothetical protein